MSFLTDSYDGNSSIASEGISSETAKVSSVIFNSADSFLAYALGWLGMRYLGWIWVTRCSSICYGL